MNPWKPVSVAFEELLSRLDGNYKVKEKEAMDRLVEKVGKKEVEEMVMAVDKLEKIDNNVLATKQLATNVNLSSQEKKVIGDHVAKESRMQFGWVNEKKVIDVYANKKDLKIVADQKFYCHPMGNIQNTEWSIGGRIDGKTDDMIIEIKNRTKRLFHKVPDYEKVQIMGYLEIFRSLGYHKLRHIECLDNGTVTMSEKDFVYDPIYWDFLHTRLHKFATTVVTYLNDKEFREKYEGWEREQREEYFKELYAMEDPGY